MVKPLIAAVHLAYICDRPKQARDEQLAAAINRTAEEHEINTPLRMAAFVAQLAHESCRFRHFEEIASGKAYEGREDLGNTQPGDGPRFKGRGPIQVTGRANYRAAGKALGLPLEEKPEMAKEIDVGFRVAGWYWSTRNLNALADQGTTTAFRQMTRLINGGLNGLADREACYERARLALGLKPVS